MKEYIIQVDEKDNPIGKIEKLEAHKNGGKLHRAFSIFIFDENFKRMLLQKRAESKYHFGGLWTNTCCSHPRWGEKLENAVHRRLKEEMGFDCELNEVFSFIYKAEHKKSGLTEWEYDHVFIGKYEGIISPNPNEADGYQWIKMDKLKKWIQKRPEEFTPWFKIALPKVDNWINKNKF